MDGLIVCPADKDKMFSREHVVINWLVLIRRRNTWVYLHHNGVQNNKITHKEGNMPIK